MTASGETHSSCRKDGDDGPQVGGGPRVLRDGGRLEPRGGRDLGRERQTECVSVLGLSVFTCHSGSFRARGQGPGSSSSQNAGTFSVRRGGGSGVSSLRSRYRV